MADYTSPEDEQFFGAIGRLTIAWGHLEFTIDCMVHILHAQPEGRLLEPDMPRSLKRKLSFLRASANQVSEDASGAKRWTDLLDQIQCAAEDRHDIIHGVVVEQEERSGRARFVRLIRKKGKTKTRQITANTTTILKAANAANELVYETSLWVSAAFYLLHGQEPPDGGQSP